MYIETRARAAVYAALTIGRIYGGAERETALSAEFISVSQSISRQYANQIRRYLRDNDYISVVEPERPQHRNAIAYNMTSIGLQYAMTHDYLLALDWFEVVAGTSQYNYERYGRICGLIERVNKYSPAWLSMQQGVYGD